MKTSKLFQKVPIETFLSVCNSSDVKVNRPGVSTTPLKICPINQVNFIWELMFRYCKRLQKIKMAELFHTIHPRGTIIKETNGCDKIRF